jgi:hypothetical protein
LPVFARDYQEVVSKIDNDLFKVDTKSILIRTENCFEEAQSEPVVLKMNGGSGEITFNSSENVCSVSAVFRSSGYRVGNYQVEISRIEENWYKISDQDIYILTDSCLIYATEQEALLSVSTVGQGGSGSLHLDKEGCKVIGLFSPIEL